MLIYQCFYFIVILNLTIIVESTGGIEIKRYFMIKEFAKLRNVHINSLLYYEKLGLLKPAYINPQTNYRYFKAEQLLVLDAIIMCIELGIPLKEMKDYIDGDGNLKFQELLDYGQKLAMKRMEEIQTNLMMIERSMNLVRDYKERDGKTGVYTRALEKRNIIISDFFDVPGDVYVVETATKSLYEKAQEYGFTPLLPTGIILHYIDENKIKFCVFLEIISNLKEHSQTMILPAGEFPCVKAEISPSSKLVAEVSKYWEWEKDMTIVIQNMYSEKYNFGSKPSEFQKIKIEFEIESVCGWDTKR